MKQAHSNGSSPRSRVLNPWIGLLLAVLAIVLAVIASGSLGSVIDLVSNTLEPIVGLGFITYVGISVLSTPLERIVLFCFVLAVLLVITGAVPPLAAWLTRRVPALAGFGLARPRGLAILRIVLVWCFLALLFIFFRPIDPRYAGIVWDNALAIVPAHLIALGYAVLLALVPRILGALIGDPSACRRASLIVIAVLAAGVTVVVPHGERMLRAAQLVFPEPAVRKLPADGAENLAGIWVDPVHDRVLVSGHGTPHFLAYDLADPGAGPRRSEAETSTAQNFAINPARKEAYVYHHIRRALHVVDTATLTLKAEIPGVDLAPGDPVVAWDDAGRVVIASEGPTTLPEVVEDAFVVADLDQGRVVARHAEYLGEGIHYDPRRKLFFGTYFRGKRDLLAYDPEQDRFVQRAPMPTNRMTMIGADPLTGDLIVAFPLDSKLVRLDPDTLEIKGEIGAMLGARRFAFDVERGLLICLGVLADLSVIDLRSGETLARYRLPQPWLRHIAIDDKRGKAYVTGRHGLYEVDYLAGLPQ